MKSFRPERVANVVRAVVGDAITNKLSDPRIEPITSVTRVEVSMDLEHARVFISVMGPPASQRRTMKGLASALGYIQTLVARQLPIRQCPQLTFHLDESIKRAAETIQLINETMAEYGDSSREAVDVQPGTDPEGHVDAKPSDSQEPGALDREPSPDKPSQHA